MPSLFSHLLLVLTVHSYNMYMSPISSVMPPSFSLWSITALFNNSICLLEIVVLWFFQLDIKTKSFGGGGGGGAGGQNGMILKYTAMSCRLHGCIPTP